MGGLLLGQVNTLLKLSHGKDRDFAKEERRKRTCSFGVDALVTLQRRTRVPLQSFGRREARVLGYGPGGQVESICCKEYLRVDRGNVGTVKEVGRPWWKTELYFYVTEILRHDWKEESR